MRHKHLIGRRSEYKIPQAALIYYYGDFAKQSGDDPERFIARGDVDSIRRIATIAGVENPEKILPTQIVESLAQSPLWEKVYSPDLYADRKGRSSAYILRPSVRGTEFYKKKLSTPTPQMSLAHRNRMTALPRPDTAEAGSVPSRPEITYSGKPLAVDDAPRETEGDSLPLPFVLAIVGQAIVIAATILRVVFDRGEWVAGVIILSASLGICGVGWMHYLASRTKKHPLKIR